MDATSPTAKISDAEMERRRRVVRKAHANNRIEGILHDPRTDPVFEAFVRGEIEATDIVPRLKVQFDPT